MTTPPVQTPEAEFRITERDMLGAMETLATATSDPNELMVLTDEELEGLSGPAAHEIVGDPYLSQAVVDRPSARSTALRSLAARHLLTPRGDATENEGDTVSGDGPERPYQLDRRLAGVITLRRIPVGMVMCQRTLAGGTTTLVHYLYPAGGVLEEYLTIDGFHHFSVPPADEIAQRIARFVDPFEDAAEDGEPVESSREELEQRIEGARAATVVTSIVDGEGSQATFFAVPGHMHLVDTGEIDPSTTGESDLENALIGEISAESLVTVIEELVPAPRGDEDGEDEASDAVSDSAQPSDS